MHDNEPGQEHLEGPAIELVLDWLNDDLAPLSSGDESNPRELLELLGSLPYALDEVTPAPRVKENIMRAIAGDASETAAPSAEPAGAMVVPFAGRNRSRAARWVLPLAAGLVLVLGYAILQRGKVGEQQATIEDLATRLSDANRATVQLADVQGELEQARSKLAMVTAKGVEVCNLEPVGDGATHGNSRGALFVASDHQRWYLKIDGLEPCPLGRVYQLWFVSSDGGTHSAGTFEVESGVNVELTAETMPEGTRAVKVTLEPRGGSEEPTGPEVLLGDEVTRML